MIKVHEKKINIYHTVSWYNWEDISSHTMWQDSHTPLSKQYVRGDVHLCDKNMSHPASSFAYRPSEHRQGRRHWCKCSRRCHTQGGTYGWWGSPLHSWRGLGTRVCRRSSPALLWRDVTKEYTNMTVNLKLVCSKIVLRIIASKWTAVSGQQTISFHSIRLTVPYFSFNSFTSMVAKQLKGSSHFEDHYTLCKAKYYKSNPSIFSVSIIALYVFLVL